MTTAALLDQAACLRIDARLADALADDADARGLRMEAAQYRQDAYAARRDALDYEVATVPPDFLTSQLPTGWQTPTPQ